MNLTNVTGDKWQVTRRRQGVVSPVTCHDSPGGSRRQLLEAAGEVFAEVGFRNATVREICRRAGVNIAAVNYHFGDKEQLYAEVLHYSQQKAFEKYPPLLGVAEDAPPEEKLHAFVRSFLLRIFDNPEDVRGTAWFGKMMSREMVEPTAALNALLETRIKPMAGLLGGILAEILGGAACRRPKIRGRRHAVPPDDGRVRLCCFSVVSQCVFFHHCRTMICRLFPEQRLNAAAVEELAGHITRFSLAAMRHLPGAKIAKARRKRRSRINEK
jgi:AcrR family transcriptional regulator